MQQIETLLKSISASLASHHRTTGPNVTCSKINYIIKNNLSDSDFGKTTINIHHNLDTSILYEHELKSSDSSITSNGGISVFSGSKTGRSPKDKRVVFDDNTQNIWWSDVSPNIRMDAPTFLINRETAICFINNKKDVYVFDGYAGWAEQYRIKVRVICTRPYHALFSSNMFIKPSAEELKDFGSPDFTIYNAGEFPCNRYTGYMTSSTTIDFDYTRKEIVILGTQYAGEMKKAIFSVMHYLMPKQKILSLHSSVNESKNGEVSIFFGLSGTGKTTLSADPNKKLIGDDEHCWFDEGIFNIEGGCYAKCIGLIPENEPMIYESIKFGALLENVVVDLETRIIDFNDDKITNNTRVSYDINTLSNAKIPCITTHPKNIIFLCCDAFGVLPPVSKLTTDQALYYFISGYTAKIAGTEQGIKEPEATFSACFGEAFLVWHPMIYCQLLKKKIEKHNVNVWLVNTGWCGGIYGVGKRFKLKDTRNIIESIQDGSLDKQTFTNFPTFNLKIPENCNNLDKNILNPINSWKDKTEYNTQLVKLSKMFINNFKKYLDHKECKDLIKVGPNNF